MRRKEEAYCTPDIYESFYDSSSTHSPHFLKALRCRQLRNKWSSLSSGLSSEKAQAIIDEFTGTNLNSSSKKKS